MSETLGALFKYLLSILALVAVLYVFYESITTNNIATETANLTTMEGNLAALYQGATSTATLSNSTVIAAAAAPTSMVKSTALVNQWGGSITVTGNAAATINIVDASLPQQACSKLVSSLQSFTSVSINGGTALTSPVDPGTAALECVSGNSNTLSFVYPN